MKKLLGMIRNKRIIVGLFVLVGIFIILLINRGTYSVDQTDSMTIDCAEDVSAGNNFECSMVLNLVTMNAKGIGAKYNLPAGVNFVSFTSDNWDVYANDEDGFVLVNLDGVSGEVEVGVVKLALSTDALSDKTYKIELVDISIGDGEDEIVTFDSVSDEIKAISDTVLSGDYSLDSSLSVDYDNNYIKYLNIGTTVADLIGKVYVTGSDMRVVVYTNNKYETEKNETGILASGDVLVVYSGDTIKDEYMLSVIGDLNGDGEIGLIDLVQMRKHMAEWIDPKTNVIFRKTEVYYYALDMNKDKEISLIDLVRMRKTIADMV